MTGRPTKYNPDVHPELALSLAIDGLTDKEIAKEMGIAKSTLNVWKKEHPEFMDSIKTGKAQADRKVQLSLYKRATGFTVKEKKVVVELDSDGNQKPARIETTEKHIVADTTAQIFWLKNRRPQEWRDKHDVDVTVNPFLELMQAATSDEENNGE
ncbi:MAG: helix-turn-helix domain-containing protein [Dysgonomonas sp.]